MLPWEIIAPIALTLDVFGILIITFGAFSAAAAIARIEIRRGKRFHSYENIKRTFVQKLIIGLDFFIAGDILRTVIMPEMGDLARLALIVGIRTVLSYFLGKEVHLHKE